VKQVKEALKKLKEINQEKEALKKSKETKKGESK
jgi:hypothetical protein